MKYSVSATENTEVTQIENGDNRRGFRRRQEEREREQTREEDGRREKTPQVTCGLEVYGGRQES